jgi:hypothetical protein
MRFATVIASGIALAAVLVSGAAAQQSTIHSVYLFPMFNGMDQYLANQLTNQAVFQVVTEPKRAQAVLTDRLGPDFEARLSELIPPPEPPSPAKEEQKQKAEAEEKRMREEPPGRFSTFSRGKGNFFLVDGRTRAVIWSTYARPENATPDELNRTARRVADRLKKFLSSKQS